MTTYTKTQNKDLMASARESLKGNWGIGIGATVLYFVLMIGIQAIPKIGAIISLLISGAMNIGFNTFILSLSRKEGANISQVFDGFKKFGVGLGAYLLQLVFVILWMLLLIIPGLIAAYSYAMTFYVLADNETMGPLDAIRKSKEMMRGNKWKLLCLTFRFFGWGLLCILSLGIGFLWLVPYMSVSIAQFYDDIKGTQDLPVDVPVTA
jgi:uncharacterized membrane protein